MSEPAVFLNAFAHALAVMTLYPGAHPSRESAVDDAYQDLTDLARISPRPSFTFFDEEVVYGREPLRELKAWSWGRRLSAAGIQRLEFERDVSRDEFDQFLQEVLARLTLSSIDTSEQRQTQSLGIRFGAVGLHGQTDVPDTPLAIATLNVTLDDEAETLRWLQHEVQSRGTVPLLEAETILRGRSHRAQ